MKEIKRSCFSCGELIEECMGFVLARDFLELLASGATCISLVNIPPRELCGKCGVRALDAPEKILPDR